MHPMPVHAELLAELVSTVWETVLGLSVEPLGAPVSTDNSPEYSACVHISGEWNGAVLLWPTHRFAVRATALLFAIPESDVTPADIQDGLAELCNMLAGNLKSVLPGPSVLSLPTVTRGFQHEVFVRRTRVVSELALRCEQEQLTVRVLEGVLPGETATVAGAPHCGNN